ncbi:MAG: hypothetical protein EOP83_33535 [Verrucomicrobiaceae bacterium]|nr:MAG: hypothetical protein EOP83_33535 [Verrucomicrobiaceae bacterium]
MDSDGVFFDFHGHFEALFGVHPDRIKDDEMWGLANGRADFWPSMPLKAGAKELWAAVRHVNPTVLTGAPKSDYDNAVRHKLQAWEDHFQHRQVITCLSKDKAMHMRHQGDWLVDDMSKNTKRWEKAGGRGYRYDGDWERCVAFLKQHGAI